MTTLPLDILYEDNHLIAVNKPAGLLTQPTDQNDTSLEGILKEWIKEKYNKPGKVFLGTIHRLDRPVSGIVLFAKTSKALSRLNASMRSREMHKTYHALVEGKPPKEKDTLEHHLRHDDYRAEVCRSDHPDAKHAKLHYKILKYNEQTTLLEVVLETGRYHQIRVQCAAMGCPIVGDAKYGSRKSLPGGIIALHHARLEFIHPVTHVKMCLEAPSSL